MLRERASGYSIALPEDTFPESRLDGRETDEGPPIEIEPDCSLPEPEREREASERGGRRGGFEGAGVAGGCGKICGKGGLSPPGTLSSDHVTLRFDALDLLDPWELRLRRSLSDFFS